MNLGMDDAGHLSTASVSVTEFPFLEIVLWCRGAVAISFGGTAAGNGDIVNEYSGCGLLWSIVTQVSVVGNEGI